MNSFADTLLRKIRLHKASERTLDVPLEWYKLIEEGRVSLVENGTNTTIKDNGSDSESDTRTLRICGASCSKTNTRLTSSVSSFIGRDTFSNSGREFSNSAVGFSRTALTLNDPYLGGKLGIRPEYPAWLPLSSGHRKAGLVPAPCLEQRPVDHVQMPQFRTPVHDAASFLSWLVETEDFATEVPANRIPLPEGSILFEQMHLNFQDARNYMRFSPNMGEEGADSEDEFEGVPCGTDFYDVNEELTGLGYTNELNADLVCDVVQIPLDEGPGRDRVWNSQRGLRLYIVTPRGEQINFRPTRGPKFKSMIPPGLATACESFVRDDEESGEARPIYPNVNRMVGMATYRLRNRRPESRTNYDYPSNTCNEEESIWWTDLKELAVPVTMDQVSTGSEPVVPTTKLSSESESRSANLSVDGEPDANGSPEVTVDKHSFSLDAPHILVLVGDNDTVLAIHAREGLCALDHDFSYSDTESDQNLGSDTKLVSEP